jgi:hypothetical protein
MHSIVAYQTSHNKMEQQIIKASIKAMTAHCQWISAALIQIFSGS